MIFFAAIGLGTCIFVQDFLAVRGLAVVFLLLAQLMVDTARWEDTEWRLVIVVWAYVLVVAGMWLTVSPWRLRDFIQWATASEQRVKAGCVARLGFGLLILALGLTAFRSAEAKERNLDQPSVQLPAEPDGSRFLVSVPRFVSAEPTGSVLVCCSVEPGARTNRRTAPTLQPKLGRPPGTAWPDGSRVL